MKLERTKEWWLARARDEGDSAVSAGSVVRLEHRGYHGETVYDVEPFVKIVGISDYASEPIGDDPSASFRTLVDDYIKTSTDLNRPA